MGDKKPQETPRVMLRSLFAGVSYPAALWSGSELGFVWTNSAFLGMLTGDPPRYDRLGMPMDGFLSDVGSAIRFQDAAYTGNPYVDPEYELRAAGGSSLWHLTFQPIPGHPGYPCDVLFTAVEVGGYVRERRREESERREMRRALDLIDTTILSSLDSEEILQRVVIEATEAFDADWGWIATRSLGTWTFRNVHGWPAEALGRTFTETELSLPRLAANARSVVVAPSFRAALPTHRMLMERHDIAAFLLVPLFTAAEVIAVMGFCWNTEPRIGEAQREVADKLAISLSLALENARQFSEQRRLARALQSGFLAVPEKVSGLRFGHLYRSASDGVVAGGDFYEIVEQSPGRVAFAIGDVFGRGVERTPLSADLKSAIRMAALAAPSPRAVLSLANRAVTRSDGGENLASAFVGLLETGSGRLTYCSAGHPPPVLSRPGEPPAFLGGHEMLLGLERGTRYANSIVSMAAEDMLVLYTDGLSEARDGAGRTYGDKRLLASIAELSSEDVRLVPEALFLDAFSFTGGRLEDDMAILALRRTDADQAGIPAAAGAA